MAIWIFSGKILRDRLRWAKAPWILPVLIFMALPWVGLLWTPDMHEGIRAASKSHHWLFAFAIASVYTTAEDIELLLKAFLAGLTVVAVLSILQAGEVIPLMDGIPTVIGAKRITGSFFLVFGIALLAYFFAHAESAKYKVTAGLLMLLFVIAIAVSGGRAGYVALIAICPLIVFQMAGRLMLLRTVVAGLFLIGILFSFSTVRERMVLVQHEIQGYEHSDPNSSVGLRLHMWQGAARIFLEHPLAGTGTAGYKQAMKRFEPPELSPELRNIGDPHNSYLYMASNYGIVGLMALFYLLYAFFRKGWSARMTAGGYAVLSYGIILCVASLMSTQMNAFAAANLFALMMGIRTEPDGS